MKALAWLKSILGLPNSKVSHEEQGQDEVTRVISGPMIEVSELDEPKCPEIEVNTDLSDGGIKTTEFSAEMIEAPLDVPPINTTAEHNKSALLQEIPIPENSLLDNSDYIKLVSENCQLLEKLDELSEKMNDDDSLKIIRYVKKQLRTCLVNAGASTIEEETTFNLLRHEPIGDIIAKNGEIIANTIEPGIAVENRVFIKAKVTI